MFSMKKMENTFLGSEKENEIDIFDKNINL